MLPSNVIQLFPTQAADLDLVIWGRNTTSHTMSDELWRIHNAAPARYAAQNARDGYLDDPEYIAAVQAWRGDLSVAAD